MNKLRFQPFYNLKDLFDIFDEDKELKINLA